MKSSALPFGHTCIKNPAVNTMSTTSSANTPPSGNTLPRKISSDVAARPYRVLDHNEGLHKKLSHVVINSPDPQALMAFYEEKLGFNPIRILPGGAMYEAANRTRFIIYPTPNAGKSPNTLMGFATADVEAEVRELKERGVVFEEYDYPTLKTVDSIATVGPTRSAWFRDSEGNIIGVVQLPPA